MSEGMRKAVVLLVFAAFLLPSVVTLVKLVSDHGFNPAVFGMLALLAGCVCLLVIGVRRVQGRRAQDWRR